jgi:hypothetical protein
MLLHLLPLVLAMSGQAAPPQQSPPVSVPATQVAAPRPATPKTYNETADAKAQIAAAITAANVDDIRVLINWGANDDDRCIKFSQVLRAPEVTKTRYSADEYKIVNVDVGHLDKNLDLARTYGVTLGHGELPALTVLDQTGKAIARTSASALSSATDPTGFDPLKVAAFLTTNQAPAPDAVAPFEAAVKQAKRDGKTVFVWFSAPW